MRTARLRVRLEDVEPSVVRVVDLPAASTVDEVHHVLQAAMGWTDRHLFEVRAGDARYGPPDGEDPDVVDARTVRLRNLPPSFSYDYDFGDAWSATVDVLGEGDDQPGLVYGEGDEPADDLGGTSGYADALAEGVLRPFDAERIGARVRRVVGRVPAGLRVFLDIVGDGVKLTPQGRLPQAVVREAQRRRPDWHRLGAEGRPAHREDDLRPLEALHDLALEARLVRVSRGVMTSTKAAADPLEVLRRTRAAFSPETFLGIVVNYVVIRLLVEGPQDPDELAADLHALVGWHWGRDGRPLTEEETRIVLAQNRAVLRGLDQIDEEAPPVDRLWRPGVEAGWLVPRTALVVPEGS